MGRLTDLYRVFILRNKIKTLLSFSTWRICFQIMNIYIIVGNRKDTALKIKDSMAHLISHYASKPVKSNMVQG